jgi:putative redox protein
MTIHVRHPAGLELGASIQIGPHLLGADLPVDEGGNGAGPTPHDLYDAALGACTVLTVLWYAKRKGIAVDDLECNVERDNSKEREGKYQLAARVRVRGALNDAQVHELEAVAAKCPVHKLMTVVETIISTTLERMA